MALQSDILLTMRDLHGVIDGTRFKTSALKHQALLFDKLHLTSRQSVSDGFSAQNRADIDYLQSRGILINVSDIELGAVIKDFPSKEEELFRQGLTPMEFRGDLANARAVKFWQYHTEIEMRRYATAIESQQNVDTVQVCGGRLPDYLQAAESRANVGDRLLLVALASLPVPDEQSSWEDILDFKARLHDKRWGFRRFLQGLATKQPSVGEIQDEIDWLVNEYTVAMRLHHIKAGQGFLEVYVLPLLEIIEDVAKFNWSKIAKGALSVKKRQVELLEAELKAPGRECAYVFDARKRFGQ